MTTQRVAEADGLEASVWVSSRCAAARRGWADRRQARSEIVRTGREKVSVIERSGARAPPGKGATSAWARRRTGNQLNRVGFGSFSQARGTALTETLPTCLPPCPRPRRRQPPCVLGRSAASVRDRAPAARPSAPASRRSPTTGLPVRISSQRPRSRALGVRTKRLAGCMRPRPASLPIQDDEPSAPLSEAHRQRAASRATLAPAGCQPGSCSHRADGRPRSETCPAYPGCTRWASASPSSPTRGCGQKTRAPPAATAQARSTSPEAQRLLRAADRPRRLRLTGSSATRPAYHDQ